MQSTLETISLDDGAATTLERWGTSGPIMLCVHGMTSSRKSWYRLAKRFGDRYQVLAYDQRGHGDSAQIEGPMSLERGVADLRNVAAVVDPDILVGHSWGGAVVIRGGELLDVDAVVAIDPMIVQAADDWYAEFIDELEETFTSTGDARDAVIRESYADWHPDDLESKVYAMHAMTTAPIAGLRDENRGGVWDLRSDIAGYIKPLLLAMGGPDGTIVPKPVMDEISAHHGPPVQIVTFEDQGHNLHRTDFDRFARTMEQFLRGLTD
jgi:pimeloyl-ACP methyl ester carboxylesterase